MEFDLLVRRRRSIRRYSDESITDDLIEKLLRNAHEAPTAGNMQPQEFVVVREEQTKRELAVAANNQDFVADAPVVIVVCSNAKRSASRYGRRGYDFYSVVDAALVSILLLLTATNEGLASCYVGAFQDDRVSEILDLPEGVRPIGIFPVGYPAEEPSRPSRMSLDRITHHDRW